MQISWAQMSVCGPLCGMICGSSGENRQMDKDKLKIMGFPATHISLEIVEGVAWILDPFRQFLLTHYICIVSLYSDPIVNCIFIVYLYIKWEL